MCNLCFSDFHVFFFSPLFVIVSIFSPTSLNHVQMCTFHIFFSSVYLPSEARLGCTQEEIGRGGWRTECSVCFFTHRSVVAESLQIDDVECFGNAHGFVFCVNSLTRHCTIYHM